MRRTIYLVTMLLCMPWAVVAAVPAKGDARVAMDPAAAQRFAALALKCLHSEYPSHVANTLDSDADAQPHGLVVAGPVTRHRARIFPREIQGLGQLR